VRIQSTDTRERLWEQLREATDHQHTSQALDAARAADGGLTEAEIAEILDTPELGVDLEVTRRRTTTSAGENDA
jgi:hypothetical protein